MPATTPPEAMVLNLPIRPDRSVSIAWPQNGLSEDEWATMLAILETMKPGLLRPANVTADGMTFATADERVEVQDNALRELLADVRNAPSWNDGIPLAEIDKIAKKWGYE